MKRIYIYTAILLLSVFIIFFKILSDIPDQPIRKHHDLLTTEQLALLLPEELKSFKKGRLGQVPNDYTVTSNYGTDEFVLTIQDAAKDNYQGIEDFNRTYYKSCTTKTFVRFPTVRNGFRTIVEIRDNAKISFVFNGRFIITIHGLADQTPTRLWAYLELSKLRALDRF